jgi:deoxyribodipyrimidine photo-lyase
MNVVWFKRDLRLIDHEPLSLAIKKNDPILCLHIIEPELWAQPDLSPRQYDFYIESLNDLIKNCDHQSVFFCVKVGNALDIFQQIHKKYSIKQIFSYQETWNNWTYERDINLTQWFKKVSIVWNESNQFAVFRCLKNRDGWAHKWNQLMNQPFSELLPFNDYINEPSDSLPNSEILFNQKDDCNQRLIGGRANALQYLESFFKSRGCHYTKAMSSPVTAPESCSRLSPYIAFGCISMKEIHHYTRQFQGKDSFNDRNNKSLWRQAVRSFSGRLRWHCHFIQKLESQPSIEFEHIHTAYHSLQYNDPSKDNVFERWRQGLTGYPLVDACMRALNQWGWLNFRMRAMVMSFASHHLWLHWKYPAQYLASQFVDYEPGIHYSQCQMQAGCTGINAIRIYNPIKQSKDHDPDGVFIKQWIPELLECPNEFIHTPWDWISDQNTYVAPIVNEKEARKYASSQLYSLQKSQSFKQEASQIVLKHASRRKTRKIKQTNESIQLSILDIET